MPNKPSIVLVHGAWADGSSWSKVIPILKEAGFHVMATQQNLLSLADDAEIAGRAARSVEGPVLLVGHSYGGAIITEAAPHCPNVVGLVYVAAFAPDNGESLSILASSGPAPEGASAIRPDEHGFLWLDRDLYAENFCQDLDVEESATMASTQRPLAVAAFEGKVTEAGWKHLPSWYQVSSEDRMIPPQAELFMSQRIHANTITIPSSHVSMISHAGEIAGLIEEAANELAGITATASEDIMTEE
jgi:pimeloyl-ACP methyl ester carboxylesterase